MCLWFVSTLSVSFQHLWSSVTSAQEVALSCTWTGVCVLCVSERERIILSCSPPGWISSDSPSVLSVCGFMSNLICHDWFVSSVSSRMTSCRAASTSPLWFGRSEVKPRARVAWSVRTLDREPLFCMTRKPSRPRVRRHSLKTFWFLQIVRDHQQGQKCLSLKLQGFSESCLTRTVHAKWAVLVCFI